MMKAAAKISPVATRGREATADIDWDECFICQDPRNTSKANRLRDATSAGIETLVEAVRLREKYNDDSYVDFVDTFRTITVSDHAEKVKWHKSCHSSFTHKKSLERLKERFHAHRPSEDEKPSTSSTPSASKTEQKALRSTHKAVDWLQCIFCQTDIPNKTVRNVEFESTSAKMQRLANLDPVMRHRLSGVSDLMAAEGKYHLNCYSLFCKKYDKKDKGGQEMIPENVCFENAMEELQKQMKSGHVVGLKTVWDYYSKMLLNDFSVEAGVYRSNRFKEKVEKFLGQEKVTFVQPLDVTKSLLVVPSVFADVAMKTVFEDMSEEDTGDEATDLAPEIDYSIHHEDEIFSWMYRVAVKIHNDIKHTQGHGIVGGLTQEHAEKVVPESLYMLVNLLCAGDTTEKEDDGDQEEGTEIRKTVLSICQDIVFTTSRGRKMTPKHLGIGLTVHQATRSKDLVRLLHAAGHSVSYDTVLRADTAIANDMIQRYHRNGNVMIPRNFQRGTGKGYERYANDNIDILEETLSGTGTFHASQYIALRRKAPLEPEMDIQIKTACPKVVHAPAQMTNLQDINMTNAKPEPVFAQPVQEAWYLPNDQKIAEANTQDLAWIMARQHQPDDQVVPGWSGFNQKVSTCDPPPTEVGPMPILNSPAHEFPTIWTVMQNCKSMTEKLGEKYTVITFDEQLYSKAKMLQWDQLDSCKDFVLMLGGFHTSMNFCKVVGKYMNSSGIANIWVESGVLGEGTAENIMDGKVWNRAIRVHKLTVEALWSILWERFKEWATENEKTVSENLQNAAKRVAQGFANKDNNDIQSSLEDLLSSIEEVKVLFNEFESSSSENATYQYWRTYMKLVSILLRFTRSLRDGDWELFLSSFAEMLPWFGAFDHYHYTRWGTVFLADMNMLPTTAPEVHLGFLAGDFVTKETKQLFNQIADDQAMEHVNKTGKVAGGLVGITKTDTARDRWSLTLSARSQLAKDTKAMFGLSSAADEDDEHDCAHKDFGKKRLKQDQDDLQKLINLFQTFNPFAHPSPDLISLTTCDVASDVVKHDLLTAEETGNEVISEFVQKRFVLKETLFHDRIKTKKLCTLESMYTLEVNTGKEKTVAIKADRDLFRRVITAMEAGRDVDINKMLEQELCGVPLSLATADCRLRLPRNKADLAKILQQNLPQNAAPAPSTTCTIVDGMAMIQVLGNRMGAKTLGEWSDNVAEHVDKYFSHSCTRVDLVFDRYIKQTIKSTTRGKRTDGKKGIRRNVLSRTQAIGKWDRFILLEENKASLANFLCEELAKNFRNEPGKELVLSGGFSDAEKVWSSSDRDVTHLSSAEHEEADTRMLLHAKEAREQGYPQVVIVSRDTDVLVLLVAHQPQLSIFVWMQTGTPRKKHFVPVHQINITDQQRESLLAFHAITGSDSTSQFAGIGKKSAWNVFLDNPHLLQRLGMEDFPDEEVLMDAESYVCKLYNPNTQHTSTQPLRCDLFHSVKKTLENFPPTQDALNLHIKRSHYQALVWRRALETKPHLPTVVNSGWKLVTKETGDVIEPILLSRAPTTETRQRFLELIDCGCTYCATRRCSCWSSGQGCTRACRCKDCRNPHTLAGLRN